MAIVKNNNIGLDQANRTNSGIITTGAQQLAGEKTFNDTDTNVGWVNFTHDGKRNAFAFQLRNRPNGANSQTRFAINKTDTGKNMDVVRYIQGSVTTSPTASLSWVNNKLVASITNPGAGITGNLIARFEISGTPTNQVSGYWVINPSTETATELVITRNDVAPGTAVSVTAVHSGNRNPGEDLIGPSIKFHNNKKTIQVFDKVQLSEGISYLNQRTINFSDTQKDFWLNSNDSIVYIRTNSFSGTIYLPLANASGYQGNQYLISRIIDSAGSVQISLDPESNQILRPINTRVYNLELGESILVQSNNGNDWFVHKFSTPQMDYKWRTVNLLSTNNIPLSSLAPISGGTPLDGQRIGVVGQTNPAENGIYVASVGNWVRSIDADDNSDFVPGFAFLVTSGTNKGDTYVLNSPTSQINVGVTEIAFTKIDNVRVSSNVILNTTGIALNKYDNITTTNTTNITFNPNATLWKDSDTTYITNSGTANVIIDPAGAQTINGKTTLIIYPGNCFLIRKIDQNGFVAVAFSKNVTVGVSNIITSNFNITPRYKVWLVDADAAGVTATLPTASSVDQIELTVKKIGGAGNVTIATQTGDKLDTVTDGTKIISGAYETTTFVSDGSSNWYII